MKNLAVLSLLCLSSAAFADKVCWDGSFGYNYARAVETAKGLEISITGNNLSLPTFYSGSGQGYSIGNFAVGHQQLHIVFPKAAVKTVNGIQTAEMKGSTADTLNDISRALFVEQSVQDLKDYKRVITPIPVLNAKAEISDEAVTLDLTQLWGYTEEGDHLHSTISVPCNHNNAPDTLRVPDKLKTYLNAKK